MTTCSHSTRAGEVRPSSLLVWLRHPEKKTLRSVTGKGPAWSDFDEQKGRGRIPSRNEARYRVMSHFVFERFEIDGISRQSADLGRCKCQECAALVDAQDACFRHQPGEHCGTISFGPPNGDRPGPAVYLRARLEPQQRQAGAHELGHPASEFEKFRSGLRHVSWVGRVACCLKRAQEDLKPFLPK